jgi:indolepyruvate ferredoxin oxidoreductase alpha subunit
VDTYQQAKLTQAVKDAMAQDEFSVVIARHPCMLKFSREQRRNPHYKPKRVAIDPSICEQIHECVALFACPSFTLQSDGWVTINPDLCIGDGSCVQTCPVAAIEKPK